MSNSFEGLKKAQLSCFVEMCKLAQESPSVLLALNYSQEEIDELRELDASAILNMNQLEKPILEIADKGTFFSKIVPALKRDAELALSLQNASFAG